MVTIEILHFTRTNLAVYVTRFDQSECVICRVIFALGKSCFSEVYVVKFSLYSTFV